MLRRPVPTAVKAAYRENGYRQNPAAQSIIGDEQCEQNNDKGANPRQNQRTHNRPAIVLREFFAPRQTPEAESLDDDGRLHDGKRPHRPKARE